MAMKIYDIIEILNITKFIIDSPRNTDTFRFILIWTKKTSTPDAMDALLEKAVVDIQN